MQTPTSAREPGQQDPQPAHAHDALPASKGTAKLVYVLYLGGTFLPVLPIVGWAVALTQRNGAPPMLRTHYQNQINLFLRGLVYLVAVLIIGFMLALTGVGAPIAGLFALVALVWWYVRVIKGIIRLSKDEPVVDRATWGF